jgi:hypothetical protein
MGASGSPGGGWPKTFIFAAAWLLLTLSFGSVRAQQEPPIETLKIDTKLVSVPVIVSDRAGRYVPGLRAHDFRLYDNDVEQKISFFDAAEEPLNVYDAEAAWAFTIRSTCLCGLNPPT